MRAVLPSLVAACSFSSATQPPVDDPRVDASLIDVPVTMIDACTTYSTQLDTCTIPVGGDMALTLTGQNIYDTAAHTLKRGTTTIPVARATVQTSTGVIDVIYTSTFTLAAGATLEGRGPLPLAIVASVTIQIDGTLDLVGPAAGSRTDALCGTSVGVPGTGAGGGAGGGGGGAFQGAGGTGGTGNNSATPAGTGGAKIARPTGLLGGCDGGGGGDGDDDGPEAGDGAGALLLAAGGSIAVTGIINAGGGHGRAGGCKNCGGSGGGSGGMVLLEANSVLVSGVIAANGGSGGEGSRGRDGRDGLANGAAAPAGAGGDSNGGDGAAGSKIDAQGGVTATDVRSEGGGGGGGGAGFIAIRCPAPMITGTISPPFAPWP